MCSLRDNRKGKVMSRVKCVVALLVFNATVSLAGPPQKLDRYAIQRDLFSQLVTPAPSRELAVFNDEASTDRKSPALAVLYSLLLPGLGEYYADGFGSGKYFSIAEGTLWLTYLTFDVYGTSLRNDARSFAATHGGIDPNGKDDQFYVDAGNFISTEEFNEKRLRERSPDRLYDVNAGFGWQWDSDVSRAQFKEARLSGETVLNNRKFVVTAIVINHLVSAINAGLAASSYNKRAARGKSIEVKADVMGSYAQPHGVMITLSRNF